MATLLYYKEAKDGQILEEGITEAGSISSFIAAGTAYSTYGVNTIPFFIFYSMFGFQRVGDFIWAAADARVPRIPARRHGWPHDAGGRRAAAPGRQQPHPRAFRADVPGLRSRLRLRTGRDHRRRHPADVRRERAGLLLHHRDERAVRDAGDARGRARRHHQGSVPASSPPRQRPGSARATHRQRSDPERGRQGAGPARQVRRLGRRLERDELQRALSRRAPGRALEPAASDRKAARAVRDRVPRLGARRGRRRVGLPEESAGRARALDRQAHGHARDGRIRSERRPRRSARTSSK